MIKKLDPITIDGKEQDFNFGVKFLNILDDTDGLIQNDVSFGFGLQRIYPQLQGGAVNALAKALHAAAYGSKAVASLDDYYDYLESLELKPLEKLLDDTLKAMEGSTVLQLQLKKLKQA